MTSLLFGRTDPERFDLYTRGSLYVFVVIEPLMGLALVANIEVETPAAVMWSLVALGVVHAIACFFLLRASVRYAVGDGARPDLHRTVAGVVTLAGIVLVQRSRVYLELPDSDGPGLGYYAVLGLLVFYGGTFAAGTRARTGLWIGGVGTAVFMIISIVGGHVPDSEPGERAALGLIGSTVAGAVLASTFPLSVWMLRVVRALDEARHTQARLAVAEERLRFARDLHDVLGRNLSVVALKSELAAQLARRDDSAAVAQMDQVRQLAENSLKEVRDVVHGYRAPNLDAELAGSRSVLEAAGVRCRFSGTGAGLPDYVQQALALVVREGTTNVLRHSEASECVVTLDVRDDAAALIMENDGVRTSREQREGSGLVGLAERLEEAGGRLAGEQRPDQSYRLLAEIPVNASEEQ